MMGKRICTLFVLVVVVCSSLVAAVGGYEDEIWRREDAGGSGGGGRGVGEGGDWFLLKESRHVVKTDAGEMKVVRGIKGKSITNPMHIGFINMEPRSFFIPQYLDSSLIIFITRGEARIGHIYRDELVEKRLKEGDIYRIEAGSAFYFINAAKDQRLHIICCIDSSESLEWHTTVSFFIAGGTYPTSVLSGFDISTLSAAFNVSESELSDMLSRQSHGPIVFLPDSSDSPSVWSKFLDMEHHQKLAHMRKIIRLRTEDHVEEEGDDSTWSVKKMLVTALGKADKRREYRGIEMRKGPGSCNIYDRKPDFKNDYGWSTALDESDYSPLMQSDVGVYLVNLMAGTMMAPHINPRATEYGIVLRGAGTIQIVFPNGTLAMKARVSEGDVFWIPRYFPFCQIASQEGPFEFFGFSTSARNNRPQFLVGANSLMHTMGGSEFAAAFGMSKDRLTRILNAQRESTILPLSHVDEVEVKGHRDMEKTTRSFGNDMVMEFN